MNEGWLSLKDAPPKQKGVFWAYPTHHKLGYCALYWDGINFSAGEYQPKDLTHWQEIILHYPERPK